MAVFRTNIRRHERDESSATGSPGRTAAAGSRGDRYLALTNNGRIFGLPPYSIQVLTMQYAQLRAQLTPNLGGIGSNVRSMVVRSTPYGRESGRYSVQYGMEYRNDGGVNPFHL
jgi:hypothetical protein